MRELITLLLDVGIAAGEADGRDAAVARLPAPPGCLGVFAMDRLT